MWREFVKLLLSWPPEELEGRDDEGVAWNIRADGKGI